MNLLHNKTGRALIAFAFYFAEGAPIGFIWWAMPTLLRKNGADVSVIGSFTAILTLPWVFKFLWAPLIDIFHSSRFGFTKWIGISQLLMCLTLFPLIFIPLEGNIKVWAVLLFLHSIAAATQDVSVDALVINVVAKEETGMLNGYMQAGMLLGRSLFGGGALYFISQIGIPITIGLMVAAISLTMLLLPFINESGFIKNKKNKFYTFSASMAEVSKSKHTWLVLAFALSSAAAFETVGGMAGPFFTDHGIDSKTIGFFFGIPVVAAMLSGGLIGGFIADRINKVTSVKIFLCAIVLVVINISFTDIFMLNKSVSTWIILFTAMYLFVGAFTTSSYALFMNFTNTKSGATQFSTYMAATNACEAWTMFVAGGIVSMHGYAVAFLIMCGVSVLSLVFTIGLNLENN